MSDRKLKQHAMTYTLDIARQAAKDVTHFLHTFFVPPLWPRTVAVHNVEEDRAYQAYDVDLLWTLLGKNGRLRTIPLEIKGDRYHKTGNFFFETMSNEGKGTTGCFLYTKAVWLFYYFVGNGRLYCLPVDRVRPWFWHQMDHFAERRTSTPVGDDQYVTVGRLVPITQLLADLPGIYQFQKTAAGWALVRQKT
jgi:hypothetical protein